MPSGAFYGKLFGITWVHLCPLELSGFRFFIVSCLCMVCQMVMHDSLQHHVLRQVVSVSRLVNHESVDPDSWVAIRVTTWRNSWMTSWGTFAWMSLNSLETCVTACLFDHLISMVALAVGFPRSLVSERLKVVGRDRQAWEVNWENVQKPLQEFWETLLLLCRRSSPQNATSP